MAASSVFLLRWASRNHSFAFASLNREFGKSA
jgi:hypothetical protein